ncbi:MAG: HypC/HybG/HupF family hydrogenase formation chaperone [Egibacteraceae bacterium]
MCLGLPGRVVDFVDADRRRALVDVGGVTREISAGLFGEDGDESLTPGDWVLVHLGFAMAKIDEDQAAEALSALRLLAEGEPGDAVFGRMD